MTRLLAVDPGPVQSAFVLLDGREILHFGKLDNAKLIEHCAGFTVDRRVIEMIASYGMAVGKEVFETCVWIGRFVQAWGGAELIYRRDVKLHLCGSAKAKDANIRQALIDKLGGPGTKNEPGATFGISGDVWQALGLAITALKGAGGVGELP